MKKKWLLTLAAVFVMGLSFSEPVQDFLGTEIVAEAAASVKAPSADKKSGTYTTDGSIKVKLSCGEKGAYIYYSLNGGGYKRYTKAITIEKNTTLKAYSKKSGLKSKIVSYSYKLSPEFKFSPEEEKYNNPLTVKLSSEVSGVKFYYTLDGSKPTAKSTKYTSSGIKITKTAKLRVMAAKSGWTSGYASKSYTLSSASSSSESILNDYTKKYAYSTLSEKQKKLYKALYEGICNFDTKISVSSLNVTIDDLTVVFLALDYENPQLFWISYALGYEYNYYGNKVLDVSPKYTRTKAEAAKIEPKLKKAADKIISKALTYDKLYDRVLYIHDTLINNTDYTISGNIYIRCADGPVLYGKALCEGYSKAFAYLCQSIGIDTICVFGVANENHVWNMIKLDGEWYHVDVTFDDPTGGKPMCTHDYFCVTEKRISRDHKLKNDYKTPEATATKYVK